MSTTLDLSLPFDVYDIELRTQLQYSKQSLIDFMVLLHGFKLYQPIQPKILERLDRGSREMLMIFREFGKSTAVEDVAVKELAFEDESFVLIFGKSDEAAQSRLSAIKGWFEMEKLPTGKQNPFKQLKPTSKGRGSSYKWSQNDIILANGNRAKAQGFMSAILGIKEKDMRPTLIIIDDPTSAENPSDDIKMIKRLLQTITPLGSPKTRILITLTPRRFTDLGMTILRDKDSVYNTHFIPAIYENGEVSCPDFWMRRGSCCDDIGNPAFKCHDLEGKELMWMHIEQKKREVKSIGWSTEYMLKPVDDGSSLFPTPTLEKCRLDGIDKQHWTFMMSRKAAHKANEEYRTTGVMGKRTRCVIGVDLGVGESVDGDYTVFTVMSCELDDPYRVLHAERFNGVSFKIQKMMLYALYLLFRPEFVKVENNGWQIVFENDMAEYQAKMPIDGHTTHNDKHMVSIGLPGMKSVFENENFELPYGDAESRKYVDSLFFELHGLTFEKGKVVSITANDDCPISHWMAYMAAKELIDNSVHIYDGMTL